jgi:hypothetical protein
MGHPGDARTYVLARRFKVFVAIVGVWFLLLTIGMGVVLWAKREPLAALILFAGWFLSLLGFAVWGLSRIPTRITLSDEVIRFETVRRHFEIPVRAVASVKVRWDDPWGGLPILRYEGGKVRLISAMEGFYDFLGRLKELNPSIEIRGL